MIPQEQDPAQRVIRFSLLRSPVTDAPPVTLKPGLNVVLRPTGDDRRLLRSVFEALTGVASSELDALLDLGGCTVALDAGFPHLHGLDGLPPPVLDVPGAQSPTAVGIANSRGQADSSVQRIAVLAATERRLSSELELTRRELEQERAREGEGEAGNESDLHPADVAVMCDRLRELLAMDHPAEAVKMAERLESDGRRRVYRVHREEALGQLIEECRAAERSAQEYLDSFSNPPRDPGAENMSIEARLEASSREAHTIARLDLLEELLAFWRGRLEELEDEVNEGNDLLAEANALLASAGELPSGSVRDAASRLRELAHRWDYDGSTVTELVEALAGYLNLDPTSFTPVGLLAEAERHLAHGGIARRQGGSAGAWRERDDQRVTELETTEHRLASQLDTVRAELGALERGRESISQPNPFSSPAIGSTGAPDGGRSFVDAVARVRTVPGLGILPVLLVEQFQESQDSHAVSTIDPMVVASMAVAGQVVWMTDRPEVLSALESMGEDVGIIGA